MSSTLPGLGITGCYNEGSCDWSESMNNNLNIIASEHFKCVTAGTGTIVNTVTAFASPQVGDAFVDATGCLFVYLGAAKGWHSNPPICGRMVYDNVGKSIYIWDGSVWKQLINCETITSSSIVEKGVSEFPSGTLGYNDSTTPWVEFQTINGAWQSTGRLFDITTCEFTYVLTKEEVSDCLLFNVQPDATSQPTPPAGKLGVFTYDGSLYKVDDAGLVSKILCEIDLQNSRALPAYADDAAADAAISSSLVAKKIGDTYYDTTEQVIKVWDGTAWQPVRGEDNTCEITGTAPGPIGSLVYLDSGTGAWTLADGQVVFNNDGSTTASHMISDINLTTGTYKVQSTGPVDGLSGLTAGSYYWLDPTVPGGYTDVRPTDEGAVEQNAFLALSATKIELLLNIPPCIVSDGVLASESDQNFIMNFTAPSTAFVPGGATGVWQTYPLNTITATSPLISSTGGSQIILEPGYCFEIDYSAVNYRFGGFMLRVFDITNGTEVPNSASIGVTSSVNATSSDSPVTRGLVEYCVTVQTTIELQYFKVGGGTDNFIARSSIDGRPQIGGFIKINKKRSV